MVINKEKYKGVTIEIIWLSAQEIYHWKAYQWGGKLHDSLKQCGFETVEEALAHAKTEIDFMLGA